MPWGAPGTKPDPYGTMLCPLWDHPGQGDMIRRLSTGGVGSLGTHAHPKPKVCASANLGRSEGAAKRPVPTQWGKGVPPSSNPSLQGTGRSPSPKMLQEEIRDGTDGRETPRNKRRKSWSDTPRASYSTGGCRSPDTVLHSPAAKQKAGASSFSL